MVIAVVLAQAEAGLTTPSAGDPRWSIVPSPNPLVRMGFFASVSCPSAEECVAVGSTGDPFGHEIALAEIGIDGCWSIQTTPAVPGLVQRYDS